MSRSLHALPPEALALLRRHNLLASLAQALAFEEAAAAIAIPAEQQAQLLQAFYGQQSKEDAEALVKRRLGWDDATIQWQAQRPETFKQLARERFLAKAEARFLKRKGKLDQVTYSLVRTQDGALARELYLRLAAGEASFAELAARYSQGPEAQSHGQIGPKPMSDAHPLLAERLRTARDGAVIEPFQVAEWWLIARRDNLNAAEFNEAMAEQMAQEALQEWLVEEGERLLASLNSSAATATTSIPASANA